MAGGLLAGCSARTPLPISSIQAFERRYPGAHIALAYQPLLPLPRDPAALQLWWRAHEVMHAASTMKIPVMIEIFAQAAAGELHLADSVVLRNRFRSIIDGSEFSLRPADDSDAPLYDRLGKRVGLRELVVAMIVRSSNLATNTLVELAGADNIQNRIRQLGTTRMEVHRGVEDHKAFDCGLNNTATAHDLMVLLAAIARGAAVNPEASATMLEILAAQEFADSIPAGLPGDCRVAHKTGWITGIRHDAALVYPPAAPPFVLVLLTKGLPPDAASETIAAVTRLVYEHHLALAESAAWR
jgi:beta-lactamase class A